jgi:peroxiredoxin
MDRLEKARSECRREDTMNTKWILAGIGALALAFAIVTWPAGSAGNGCDPDARPARLDFVVKDMNGNDVRFADFKGKVILLNFWATWCPPCRVEIPAFVELQDKYRDDGLVILGLSIDDPVESLKPFAEEFRMNYPVLVGADRDDIQEAFGPLWGIPVTVIINRDGKICKRHMGFATKEQFEREIRALL